MEDTKLREVKLGTSVEIATGLKDLDAVLTQLDREFAGKEAGVELVSLLRSLPPEQAERWLMDRPDADRIDPVTDCVIIVTTVTVLVVVAHEIITWFNEVTGKVEEKRRPIYEEKEVEKRKKVCPGD